MPYDALEQRRSIKYSEPERRVEETDALIRQTVAILSRNCPPHLVCEVARENLLNLTPHLIEALDAVENIERQRSLTEQEHARRRAFRMLLAYSRR